MNLTRRTFLSAVAGADIFCGQAVGFRKCDGKVYPMSPGCRGFTQAKRDYKKGDTIEADSFELQPE